MNTNPPKKRSIKRNRNVRNKTPSHTINNNENYAPTSTSSIPSTTSVSRIPPRNFKLANRTGMKVKTIKEARFLLEDHSYCAEYTSPPNTPYLSTICTVPTTVVADASLPSTSCTFVTPIPSVTPIPTPVLSTFSTLSTAVVDDEAIPSTFSTLPTTVVDDGAIPSTSRSLKNQTVSLSVSTTHDASVPSTCSTLSVANISLTPHSSPSFDHSISSTLNNPSQPNARNQPAEQLTSEQQFNLIKDELQSLRQGQEFLLTTFEYGMETAHSFAPLSNFKIDQMHNRETLEYFNTQLANAEYMAKTVHFIKAETGEYRQTYLMHRAIDILFTPELVASCSWSGVGNPQPKISFKSYAFILDLFSILGATNGVRVPAYQVQQFFQTKFNHAKRRLQTFRNIRISVPRSFRRSNRVILQDMANKEQKF